MRHASDLAPLPWTVVRGETGEDIIRHFTPEASSIDVALIWGYRRRRRARA